MTQTIPQSLDSVSLNDDFSLAQLACYAATELDFLSKKENADVNVITGFNRFLENHVEKRSSKLLDPATITVLSCAFVDAKFFQPSPKTTLMEFQGETTKLLQELRSVAADPAKYASAHPQQLERLRDVCLALSRQALAVEYSFNYEELPDSNIA